MTENYVTLFNYNYLPQGLTMYFSLKKNLNNFCLWVVCMDSKVENFFLSKKYEKIKIIPLRKIENNQLLKVKKKRKFVEYCWTLTPFLPDYLFNKKKIEKVTYLDADIFFFRSPIQIIDEFKKSKKSVYITEHGFHKDNDQSKVSGKFCVQYMIFKKNKSSKKILKWWQEKCIEWCFDYPDNGRLGDQKYLDQWPKLFKKNIHISKNRNFFQGPWTFDRFNINEKIIYHFHGLKINNKKVYIYNNYGFTKLILKKIYLPYVEALRKTLDILKNSFVQNKKNRFEIFKDIIKNIYSSIFLNLKKRKNYIMNLK